MKNIHKIYLVEFNAEFPAGIAAGAGSLGNQIQLARNGRGEWVLNGTAIAGVLRSQMQDSDFETDLYFGAAHGSQTEYADDGAPSLLKVEDVVLKTDAGEQNRVSHLRCRHTGSVTESALYSIAATPPKTQGHFRLWLVVPYAESEGGAFRPKPFLEDLAGKISRGILFGGNSNRGVGRAELCGDIQYKCYDLLDEAQYAEYLDDSYAIRSGRAISDWQILEPNQETQNTLTVEWNFIIPPGEDLLVSDGKGLDAESEPHRITGADGNDYWLLPGSTLRGLFRDWCNRLAAREGKQIADRLDRFDPKNPAKGDDLGWLFQKDRKGDKRFLKEIDEQYLVESMFGSLHKRGRLHISDGLSKIGANLKRIAYLAADDRFPVQFRKHVALDAISGAAVEGALFDNFVLTSGGGENAVKFPIKLILQNPKEDEIRWLAKTLQAIHIGLLRVGSSKSSGRLAVEEGSLKTFGRLAKEFQSLATFSDPSQWELKEVKTTAEEGPNTSANLIQLKGRMKGDLNYTTTYRDQNGNCQTIKIPKSIWNYRPGVACECPEVILSFDGDKLVNVEIPGKQKTGDVPPKVEDQPIKSPKPRNKPISTNEFPKGKASLIGMPFYNPYTFIPFAKKGKTRNCFTPQTADEKSNPDRFTGVLKIELETLSPLLTSEGWSDEAKRCAKEGEKYIANNEENKRYHALTVGKDVVLPATGVRGFLRNLLTIISGGPLTVLNEDTYLCQGRDVQISENPGAKNKKKPILARVVTPGNSLSPGVIEIGRTELFSASSVPNIDSFRPKNGEIKPVWGNYHNHQIFSLSFTKDAYHTVRVKLSGQPVNTNGDKKEGIFIEENLKTIQLGPEFWSEYNNRNRFGMRPELKEDDLVWVETKGNQVREDVIERAEDIASIQWARWGRRGVKIDDVLPDFMIPDSHQTDKKVSMVTDLFGQVAYRKDIPGVPFKGRIRPGNLIFKGMGLQLYKDIQLAVMSSPRIGCTAFYRKETDPNSITNNETNPLRGYKVYRNEKNLKSEPWRYEIQGVYDEFGRLKVGPQNVTFNADIVPEKSRGRLEIALRGLSPEEFGLLNLACKALWHIGGGKPIGLGACKVIRYGFFNENGEFFDPTPFQEVKEEWETRLALWEKTQKPVKDVRYPRAVVRNKNKNTRGGMNWFQKLSSMKKGESKNSQQPVGLEPVYVRDELKDKVRNSSVNNSAHGEGAEMISGQTLPFFPEHPEKEFLYGYDAFFCDVAGPNDSDHLKKLARQKRWFNQKDQKCYPKIERFDESKHLSGTEKSGENHSPNRDTRNDNKRNREEN